MLVFPSTLEEKKHTQLKQVEFTKGRAANPTVSSSRLLMESCTLFHQPVDMDALRRALKVLQTSGKKSVEKNPKKRQPRNLNISNQENEDISDISNIFNLPSASTLKDLVFLLEVIAKQKWFSSSQPNSTSIISSASPLANSSCGKLGKRLVVRRLDWRNLNIKTWKPKIARVARKLDNFLGSFRLHVKVPGRYKLSMTFVSMSQKFVLSCSFSKFFSTASSRFWLIHTDPYNGLW